MDFFIIRSRLAPFENRTGCPVMEWFDIQMHGTGVKSNPKTDHGQFRMLTVYSNQSGNFTSNDSLKTCLPAPV
jgi:hypothetical protein